MHRASIYTWVQNVTKSKSDKKKKKRGKKKAREPQKRPLSLYFYCSANLYIIMAVIQETNDDTHQKPTKEVVVNTNIAESDAEESEVDEEHEENNEEGNS